ncbi:MAG: SIS domain-containing protein, partial [Thioalkalivibrio sp.]|nr:SIS domain-containing protein [Thioalkalivibrio sp.]
DGVRVAPLINRYVERSQANMRATLVNIDPELMAALCRVLVAAHRVWVYGQRLSFGVAFNLALHLQQLLPDVRLVDGAGGTTPDQVSQIRTTDHVVIVAHARTASDKLSLARHLGSNGVAYSLITDLGNDAELVRGASFVLRSRTRGSGSFNDFTASVALAQVLVATLEAAAPTARSRLVQVESTLHAFAAFAIESKGGHP